MKIEVTFSATTTPEIEHRLDILSGIRFCIEVPDKSCFFDRVVVGLVCTWTRARKFNGIEPKFSRKDSYYSFGVYLDHDTVLGLKANSGIADYSFRTLRLRIAELVDYEKLSGIKDRTFLTKIDDAICAIELAL
jgi:hypothetical protein